MEQVFCQNFTATQQGIGEIVTVPLCEGGEERMVTEETRREYVELYINYVLNSSIHRQASPQATLQGLSGAAAQPDLVLVRTV